MPKVVGELLYRGWIVQNEEGSLITESFSYTRRECIEKFMIKYRKQDVSVWPSLRQNGYTCLKVATIKNPTEYQGGIRHV